MIFQDIRRVLAIAVVAVSCLATMPATARTLELVGPFRDFALREPQNPPPPGPPRYYSATAPAAQWGISQWNLPGGKLPPFTMLREGQTTSFISRAAVAAVKVVRTGEHTSIFLSQNGDALPCRERNGRPFESDLFISPKDPRWAGRETALLPAAHKLVLGRMTALVLRAEVGAEGGVSRHPKGCEVSQGSAIVSLVLRNTAVRPAQTLFYQLALNQICGPELAQRWRACTRGMQNFTYFSRKPPFGADDSISLLGIPLLTTGTPRHIIVDLRQRLARIIAAGPPALDKDLSHWEFGSTYIGQHIWGDVRLSTQWRSFRLTAQTRPGD